MYDSALAAGKTVVIAQLSDWQLACLIFCRAKYAGRIWRRTAEAMALAERHQVAR